MNFQVPQFIEIEDKIFGPLTFKQFVFVIGGGGASYVAYVYGSKFLGKFLAVLLVIPIAALALALAFYRINDRPFILTMEAAFRYFLKSKLYRWRKGEKGGVSGAGVPQKENAVFIPKLSEGKLDDLSWSLDINEKVGNQE